MSKKEIKAKVAQGWLLAKVIVEIVGKPKTHVDKTIKDYVKSMPSKTLILVKEEYHKAIKHEGNLFAAFVELDILFSSLNDMVYFCFDFMPSSIEVYEPEELTYKARDITAFINDVQGRSHDLDLVAKQLKQQNIKLNEGFTSILKNFILISCVGGRTIPELQKIIGLEQKFIKKVIDLMIKEKRIKKDGESYITLK
ncbi:hypothetical protein GOV08_03085 [Candidatus Woesearchaeota archaeon]|nr:hypothetical protein [Candidatus Woesearchaeota archaeon]